MDVLCRQSNNARFCRIFEPLNVWLRNIMSAYLSHNWGSLRKFETIADAALIACASECLVEGLAGAADARLRWHGYITVGEE
jgi:hypothetical protein